MTTSLPPSPPTTLSKFPQVRATEQATKNFHIEWKITE